MNKTLETLTVQSRNLNLSVVVRIPGPVLHKSNKKRNKRRQARTRLTLLQMPTCKMKSEVNTY